jgi:hypothetical protein
MASLNNNNRKREVHNRTSLTYRKGKQRLRPLSVQQLTSKLESAQSNRLKDAVGKELARRIRMGIFSYNPPVSTEK